MSDNFIWVLLIVLFFNFGSNKKDLYDVIYDALVHYANTDVVKP